MGRLIRAIVAHIVVDCPPELAGCIDCNEPSCNQGQWEVCTRRLVAVAALTTQSKRGTLDR
jgi:hypothetical protein